MPGKRVELLGVSAYAVTSGATRLGLLGQRQEARVMECSVQGGGGRAGDLLDACRNGRPTLSAD
ncbi:hypothetical protein MTP02_40360 [Streptomyces albus]|nr:hypothetical protein MTP02_40360 [Streptomyces albus]